MKKVFNCPMCFKEDNHPLFSFFEDYLINEDEAIYECPRKHKFRVVSRNDKYRILFDTAIIQLQDGFSENAILNAYTSLEEFMKFFILFQLYIKKGNIKEILDFLKSISRSENKKGAFLLSYFELFNENNIGKKIEEFAKLRNSIIHNGYFVGEQEAYNYCKKMYNFINGIILNLNKLYKEIDYINMNIEIQRYFKEKEKNKIPIAEITESIPSILPSIGQDKIEDFESLYEAFKTTRTYTYENPLKKYCTKDSK